ncbi:DNA-binding response regulator [Chimaeribacter coloradensis]|uniref:DNA-binding response regulator n=1 Tax=Chimaeribacter coloradensis TaxID=2060068 RepID=A0A2N5E411_9GAMM|nr:response regulator [Chimaeribacter coloradensis]PLR35557.1 DNA-binding response regulator [Chimaeribacter coloradensis]
MKKILIIEDDLDAANVLEAYLRRDQFLTVIASNGQHGLEMAFTEKPDLILLDVMLPGMSGTDVMLSLRRKSDIPVIMVTAIGDEPDKISALRYGADDYIVKPYNPGEVVARVQAVLRRTRAANVSKLLEYDKIRADVDAMRVNIESDNGVLTPVELTPTELGFLLTFMAFPQKAFSRQALLDACLPNSEALERVVDTHIYNLRKKLEAAGQTNVLVNVRGIGYRLAAL